METAQVPTAAAQVPPDIAQPSTLKKIVCFPLTRLLVGLIVCLGTAYIVQFLLQSLLGAAGVPDSLRKIFINGAGIFAVLASYILLYAYYEKRNVTELSGEGFFPNALAGTVIGAGVQSSVIAILSVLGYYSVVSFNGFMSLLPGLGIAISSGVIEEVVFRGILFRLTEEKLGSVVALIVTSLLFGLGHIFNPNATLYSAAAIAIEAGIVLGAAYMATRKLWLPIFIHISWNFAEGGIFGAALSGSHVRSALITSAMRGPSLLTGGAFGPENSLFAVALCLPIGAALIHRAYRRNMVVAPFWRQPKRESDAAGRKP